MLDVHAPEHPIHGVREFFIHLFTITVGLLIALGLENVAEWRHHVHIRHEAEANIRREIESNRHDLQEVVASIPKEQAGLREIAVFLEAKIGGQKVQAKTMRLGVEQATLQEASWNTATSTGALSYMEYSEVERFSNAYTLQKKFDAVQNEALPPIVGTIAILATGDPDKLSVDEARDALRNVRLTIANLETVRGMGTDVAKTYDEALKTE